MRVVVAPDSFKGALDARGVCAAVVDGVRRVFGDAVVVEVPLADGGEGTAENLAYATGGRLVQVEVRGPLGLPVQAVYGVLGDGETAVVEMAQASGLTLVPDGLRNPLLTTSYGTGELILAALDAGLRKFVIGLGGSATNDGGAGMLRALGARFLDRDGRELADGGGALVELEKIELTGMDRRLEEASFLVASDVLNVLCGNQGASAVFGPQKGANAEMVEVLDRAVERLAEVAVEAVGVEMRDVVGGGAAGGMGAAVVAFLGGEIRSGIEVVMEAVRFEELVAGADLVITGEGRLDEQTLSGKVIAGVCRVAGQHGVPVVALCGSAELSGAEMDALGLTAGVSIVHGPCSLAEAMANTARWTADRTEQVLRMVKRMRK